MRFEIIHNIPSPYRLHLFSEMYRQLSARGVDFCVNFMAEKEPSRPRSWTRPKMEFPHRYWKNVGLGTHFFNPGLIWYLLKTKPDYLMVGSLYDTFTSLAVTAFCRFGVRCTWVEGQTKSIGAIDGWKGWIKCWSLSHYRYVAVPGSDGIAYVRAYQDRSKRSLAKPVVLPNLVDESRFKPREYLDAETFAKIRSDMGASVESRVCIIPARLIPVKGLCPFIRLLTAEMLKGWKVVIIGEGPLAAELTETVKDCGLQKNVNVLGFVDYDKMPLYYAASDLFLLPSLRDQNPLSVVEALHAGLPIALSNQAGNVEEAVTVGRNGWVLPVADREAFKGVLQKVFATNRGELRERGHLSREENARFWRTKECVASFLNEIGAVR